MKRFITTLVAAASLVLVSACGSSDTGTTNSESANGGSASGELTKVTVGAIPIGDVAPLYLGKAKGFFEAEGIDLNIESTSGGAVSLPGVVSGSFDFAFVNIISLMIAQDQGLDVQYVTNGSTTTGVDPDNAAVLVLNDSPIKTVKDLSGKTVSSNQLKNIGDTAVRDAVDQGGGDGASLNFVEVAFQDALAALQNHQLDAALVLDPFLTQALESGEVRAVSWPYAEVDPNLDTGGYFTMKQTIKDKPELVASFQKAMNKSLEYAQEHTDEVRDIIGTYTKMDAATIQKITLPRFLVDFHRDADMKLGEAAVKYGTLSKAPNLDELLPAANE